MEKVTLVAHESFESMSYYFYSQFIRCQRKSLSEIGVEKLVILCAAYNTARTNSISLSSLFRGINRQLQHLDREGNLTNQSLAYRNWMTSDLIAALQTNLRDF